jgi:hypothetical protein
VPDQNIPCLRHRLHHLRPENPRVRATISDIYPEYYLIPIKAMEQFVVASFLDLKAMKQLLNCDEKSDVLEKGFLLDKKIGLM